MSKHVRWYVNVGNWKPTRDEWLGITSCVAEDEVTRINKFVYQEDAKSALIGRALIRKFISQAIARPSNELQLTRSEKGRPEVCKEYRNQLGATWPKLFDFNISHSGDHCVLAGVWDHTKENYPNLTVGVDVTKIVKKETKPEIDRFLTLMSRRQFLPEEWEIVEKASTDRQKCINFTRLWCLKESFIKSIGLGLSFKLDRICFTFSEEFKYNLDTRLLKNNIISDTRVLLDNKLASDWRFMETALDDEHLVALGFNIKECNDNKLNCDYKLDKSSFVELSIDNLRRELTPIRETDETNWTKFSSRSHR